MKLVDEGELEYGRIKSEGKILEITPLLFDANGQLTALPPVAYQCPNWLLGYKDYHSQGYQYNLHPNYRDSIPGSETRANVQLGFMVRIYEYMPGMVLDTIPTIPEEWAIQFAEAVKTAIKENKENGE